MLALDSRNHGASPHDPDMSYAVMARDVLETLDARSALPCRLVGHSVGGKVSMRTALARPGAVERLAVVDIAPAAYPPAFRAYAEAMRAIPLAPGLTRAQADAALVPVVPDPGVRAFLLQNSAPRLRAELAVRSSGNRGRVAGRRRLEIAGGGRALRRTDAVHVRRSLRLHPHRAPGGNPRSLPSRPFRERQGCGALGSCRKPRRLPRGSRGFLQTA